MGSVRPHSRTFCLWRPEVLSIVFGDIGGSYVWNGVVGTEFVLREQAVHTGTLWRIRGGSWFRLRFRLSADVTLNLRYLVLSQRFWTMLRTLLRPWITPCPLTMLDELIWTSLTKSWDMETSVGRRLCQDI